MSSPPITILVITNDPAFIQACVGAVSSLRSGRKVEWVAYTWDMLSLVLEAASPILLADLRTPEGDDLNLLDSMAAALPNATLLALVEDDRLAPSLFSIGVFELLTRNDLTPHALERVVRLAHQDYLTRAELGLVKAELLASQNRLHSIFENAPIGISLVALDGTTVLNNPTVSQILGYSRAELDGLHFATYMHPEDVEPATRYFNQITTASLASQELRFIRADGTYVWCDVKASVVRDPEGRPLYLIGTLQDITAQKLSDQLLLASEQKFRTLAETTAAAIAIHNGKHLLYVNNSLLEQTGYSEEAIFQVSVWELVHPDHREIAKRMWQRRKTGKPTPRQYELKFLFRDKREVWMDVTAGMIEYEGQQAALLTGFDITARKQAEAALQEQVQLIQTLIDTIPHPIDYRDTAGVLLGFNEPYLAGMGVPREALINKSVYEIYGDPVVAKINYDADQATIQSGQVTEEYLEMKRLADGEYRFIWRIKAPVRRPDGEISGVVTILTDITSQKEAEAALRTSEQQYRMLADNASDLIYRQTITGAWAYLSPSVVNLLGYQAEDLVGRPSIELVHPDDRPSALAVMDTLKTSPHTTQSVTYRLRHRSGEYRWFEVLARAVQNPDSSATEEIIAIGRDVTSRVEAEEALRQSEDRFAKIFHASPVAIAITAYQNGVILDCNEAFEQLFGYAKPELLGRSTLDLPLWSDVADRDKLLDHLQAEGAVHFKECRFRHKSGRDVLVLASFEPIELNGQPSLVTMFYDISQRKQVELALKSHARQQAVIAQLGQYALEDHRLGALLKLAADLVCEGLAVTYALVFELDTSRDTLVIRAQTGFLDQMVGEDRPKDSLAGYTLQVNRAVVVEDRRSDPRVPYGAEARQTGLISSIAVVIPGSEVPFGVLSAHTSYPHQFSDRDVDFMHTVANLLATAVNRLQVRQALMESRERFRIVSELSSDYSYCYRIEPDGRLFCLWVTDAYTRITGYPVQSMQGTYTNDPFGKIHPDDIVRVVEQTRALRHNRPVGPTEFRTYTKSGDVVWVQNYLYPVWDPVENRLIEFIGSASDITPRKRRERELEAIVTVAAALRQAPNRASILSIALNEMVDILPFDGAILTTVNAGEDFLTVETTLRQWRDADHYFLPLQNTFAGRVVTQARLMVVNDVPNRLDQFLYPELFDGIESVVGVPLIADEKTFGALLLGRRTRFDDEEIHLLEVITEVIANAFYRASLTETLADRVAQRTAELQEANAQLQVLDQLKSKFVSDVSHELRTPVTNLGMHLIC